MNYCRRGLHSDVYLYATPEGEIVCEGCLIRPADLAAPDAVRFSTYPGVIAHLAQHLARRHRVPTGVIETLRRESDVCHGQVYPWPLRSQILSDAERAD
jgi:hypothetical protein